MSFILTLGKYLPSVRKPEKNVKFKKRLIWTGLILLLYFVMSETYVVGGIPEQMDQFQALQTIMGSEIGTLVTLGIGPIVTASIILQLLVGSEIIPWDLNSSIGKQKFQYTQKILAYTFGFVQAFAFVFMGAIQPIEGFFALVVAQLTIGAWLIVLMDEVVSKWGFHSGVSLFILAGVSKTIVVRLLSPLTGAGEIWFMVGEQPAGALLQFMTGTFTATAVSGLIFTLIVFMIAAFASNMRVEIPLTFGNVRGFGRKWPLKFLYTSVMPVIFVSAIVSNIRLWVSVLTNRGIELSFNLPFMDNPFYIFGQFTAETGALPNSLIYYFSAPTNLPQAIWNSITTGTLQLSVPEIIQVFSYTGFYVVAAAVFSVFWMRTSSQDPSSVADQIMNIGMKVPGFRKDKRVIVKILNRYIPALAVLGGAFIGFLAALADFTNAFGTGTGILLAVFISFQFYEEIVKKHMEDMHPALRNLMGNF